MTFEEWWDAGYSNQVDMDCAKQAWDYQQQRIDELELALSKMETLTGYVLVPVEPTDMALDFYIRYHNFYPFGNDVKNIARHFYEAMIQAAQEQE